MRFALHCGTLRGHGSGHVGRNVLASLAAQAAEHQLLAWVPEEWRRDHPELIEGLPGNVRLVETQPGLAQKFVVENWQIRRELRSWGADALFSLGDTSLPGCPVPHMLMVHQAHLAYGPAERGFPVSGAMSLRWRAMETYLRAALPTVSVLTVQTEDMRDRLCARFSFPRDRVQVVPSAVDVPARAQASAAREEHICYVASPGAHKNFRVLAPMMAALRERSPELLCRLTVTGEQVPELVSAANAIGVLEAFVFEGAVSRERVLEMVAQARALVMPSRLESFGLPYYEALAMGTPVVASDRGFAREACGEAGAYADPDSGDEFAEAITPLLEDDEIWSVRSQASADRYAAVGRGWEDIAQEYLALLVAMADRG